jgi:hypothetical protein
MKAGLSSAPKPIQGIPHLQSLIQLLFHLCCWAQTHCLPASEVMNLLFCTCPRNVYGFFTADPYPTNFAPFSPMVDEVPDHMGCVDENDHASKCAKHALDKKTRADIVTMNAALTDVFLDTLSLQVGASFQQHCLCKPNIVFDDMFEWFVGQYGKTTAKDCNANRQRMAADWHPINGFDNLTLPLFTGVAYAGCTGYTMADRDIVNIGLRVIKWCGMYAKEYKAWIACKSKRPKIVETFDMFKTFWAMKITLVNKTAVPASMHGYGMAAVNDDDSVVSYGDLIANFGAAYAATHKFVKSHSSTIASMQGQLRAMQQFCMAIQQQQPPPPTFAPQQQQRGCCGLSCCNTSSGAGRGYPAPPYQQPTTAERHLHPFTPFKRFDNWNYGSTHGGDIHHTHTSGTCRHPGPSHNPSATRTNTLGGLTVGLHKTILPSIAGRAPPPLRQQRAPATAMWQQPPLPVNNTYLMAAMHLTMPMMPLVPYQALYHISQQFSPNPPAATPLAPPMPQTSSLLPYDCLGQTMVKIK